MTLSALPFLETVLTTGSLQARKNAMTALRILGTEESVDMLVDFGARTDVDALRERAVEEIGLLEGAARDFAFRSLRKDRQGKERARVYRLLGALSVESGGALSRGAGNLSDAMRLWPELYKVEKKKLRFYLRGFWPGVPVTAAVSLAWIGLLYWGLNTSADDAFFLAFAAAFLAMGYIVVATVRSTPIGLQSVGGFGAIAVEVLTPVLLVLVPTAVVMLFADGGAGLWLPATLMVAGLAGGVRLGTIAAYGLLRTSRDNWIAESVVGAVGGLAVLSAGAVWLLSLDPENLYSTNLLWTMFVPVTAGMAVAFGKIDRSVEKGRRVRQKPLRFQTVIPRPVGVGLSAMLLAVVLLPAMITLAPDVPERRAASDLATITLEDTNYGRVPIEQLPYSAEFELNSPRTDAAVELTGTHTASVRVFDGNGSVVGTGNTLSLLTIPANRGTQFTIDVSTTGSAAVTFADEVFPVLHERLFERLRRSEPEGQAERLAEPMTLLIHPTEVTYSLPEPVETPGDLLSPRYLPEVYGVRLSEPSVVHAVSTQKNTDAVLRLIDSDGSELARGDDPPEVQSGKLEPGTYYLILDMYGSNPGATMSLISGGGPLTLIPTWLSSQETFEISIETVE
jgi:hypothetical protein